LAVLRVEQAFFAYDNVAAFHHGFSLLISVECAKHYPW